GNVPCKSPGEGCPESKQDDEADGKFEGEPVAHPGCAAVGPEHRCLVHFNEIVQALMKTLEFLMARRSRRAAIQFAKNLCPRCWISRTSGSSPASVRSANSAL